MAVVGLAGVVLVGRGKWRSTRLETKSTELDPADPARRAEVQDLQNDVARLETALAHTQERLRQIEANEKPPGATTPAPAEPVARPKLTPEQLAEARQKVLDEYKARARTFETEAADSAWAKREEDRITSVMKTALPQGAKVENASCRTTLCKIEIAFSNPDDRRPFGTAFSNDMDAESLRGYHFDELDQRQDGTYPLQVLLFRSGYPMPGFAQ